jgi:hypothetical protein
MNRLDTCVSGPGGGNTEIAEMENPLDPSIPYPLLAARFAGRFACIALLVAAGISGAPLLEWISVPVLFLTLVVVWGVHVLLIENLHALPQLHAEEDSHDPAPPLPRVCLIVSARNEESRPYVRSLRWSIPTWRSSL